MRTKLILLALLTLLMLAGIALYRLAPPEAIVPVGEGRLIMVDAARVRNAV